MNPLIFNCVLLYVMVIVLSLFQSRLRVVKDDPGTYLFIVFVFPILVLGKARGIKTWTELTAFEIFAYTLMIAYMCSKRIIPRINEGYIFAYTLFHWYLLADTIHLKGLGFWTSLVALVSIYPSFLIIRNAFEDKLLPYKKKVILYYWFLFTIGFTYIDQMALEIIEPVKKLYSISLVNSLTVFVSAVQVYFIATVLSLLFVGIPVFHLDRSSRKFSERWKDALKDWREILNNGLDNYIEYQLNMVQAIYIILFSLVMFYIDQTENFRHLLIFIYTVILPLVFFYLKWSPEKNIE